MLDIAIRDASDNKHSLDDVMRSLYQSAYKQGRGFTPAEWWARRERRRRRQVVRRVQRALHRRARRVSVGQHSADGGHARATGARAATRREHAAGRQRRAGRDGGRRQLGGRGRRAVRATISIASATYRSRTSSSARRCARATARRPRALRSRSRFKRGTETITLAGQAAVRGRATWWSKPLRVRRARRCEFAKEFSPGGRTSRAAECGSFLPRKRAENADGRGYYGAWKNPECSVARRSSVRFRAIRGQAGLSRACNPRLRAGIPSRTRPTGRSCSSSTRISFVTVFSASSSSIGIEMPDTRVVSVEYGSGCCDA